MDNLLLTSNSALLIKKLRKRKIKANEQLFQKSYLDKSKFKNYNFDKSFNIRTDMTPKSMLPSLSSTKVKYLTKSNSRASSSKDESNNKDSVIKNKIYNKSAEKNVDIFQKKENEQKIEEKNKKESKKGEGNLAKNEEIKVKGSFGEEEAKN